MPMLASFPKVIVGTVPEKKSSCLNSASFELDKGVPRFFEKTLAAYALLHSGMAYVAPCL